jgi:pSer/pThr/pTyr-binding forkhead associated (FHA) protein
VQGPVLRVEKVQADSAAHVGACLELPTGESVVGRDPHCVLVLADPRVSREHARLRNTGDGVWIENLSRHALLVNGQAVVGAQRLAPFDWVQIGGVLVRFYPTSATLSADPMTVEPPALGPLSTPSHPHPALVVDVATGQAALAGVPLRLQPGPFAVLVALASRPSAWVSAGDLATAIWPDGTGNEAYVNKYVSYVRTALADAAADPAAERVIRDGVRGCADPWTDVSRAGDAIEDVLREFVKGRKKVGFRLHLAAGDAAVRSR